MIDIGALLGVVDLKSLCSRLESSSYVDTSHLSTALKVLYSAS